MLAGIRKELRVSPGLVDASIKRGVSLEAPADIRTPLGETRWASVTTLFFPLGDLNLCGLGSCITHRKVLLPN